MEYLNYQEIIKHFGTKLTDSDFQAFLKKISCDPTTYNVAKSEYIISKNKNIEIGFNNDDAEYDEDEQTVFKEGTPIFAFFNLYPNSNTLINSIPFKICFTDTRKDVREKAGQPIKIVDFEDKFLKKRYMIDHFKMDNLAMSIDYHANDEKIEVIQIRDNRLAKEHLRL